MTSGLPARRIEAVRLGEKFYFPKKECKNGQIDVWLTSRSACWCEKCRKVWREKQSREQKKNKHRVRKTQNAWRSRNFDRAAEYRRRFNEKVARGDAVRSEGCPGKRLYRNAMRRKACRVATPKWADKAAIRAIYLEAGRRRAAGEDVHVDHIYPLQGESVCGLHVAENLQIIPATENRRKHNSLPRVGAECDAQVRGLQAVVMATRQVKDGNEKQ